jgi:nucleotide sugar dehydrogenase
MWSDVVEAETIRVPAVSGVVVVIGLGRVGLPTAVQYATRGWRVLACDANPRVVESINERLVPLQDEPELEKLLPGLVERGLLSATLNIAEGVARANVVVVTVPVQLDEERQVRFHELDMWTETIGRALQPGTLVSYEMPLPVGTTASRLQPLLEQCSGMDAGREFYLAYSPEHVTAGRAFCDLRTNPKVVGGIDARSTHAAAAFYRSALPVEIVTVASTSEAEFVKLLELTYRDVNIALANEFACYADEQGLDVMAAIAAANSQPCVHIHRPGVGVGGHALPKYPYLLINNLATNELPDEQNVLPGLSLPRAARRINDSMAEYAVQRIEAEAGSLWRRSVLLLGVAYREDVREVTFSSAYGLQTALWRHGATVYVDDPLYTPAELHALGFQPLPPGREDEIDAMILQAAHRAYQTFDFRRFARCRVVLDGRHGLLRACVREAGIRYMALGNGVEDAAQCMVPFRGEARP